MPPSRPSGYTIADTPEVLKRVEGDLALVLQEVRAADKALRALVLTGGFARGEGAMLDGKPQNDYDFVALRGLAPASMYDALRARLERALGLHVDLQPVWTGRLPWAARSIFWYETALRGRVLWGPSWLLHRIPVRDPRALDRKEGLRLLVNRAAGLLLAEPRGGAHLLRIQASKGFLAALDAHLLALDSFEPSQRERWARFEELLEQGRAPPILASREAALRWAFTFKVAPGEADPRDAQEAWREAGLAILASVPVALAHAGFRSLAQYARADSPLENAFYRLRAGDVPGARRWAPHPTGRVRAATLALLAERCGASLGSWQEELRPLVRAPPRASQAVDLLGRLRRVTLQ